MPRSLMVVIVVSLLASWAWRSHVTSQDGAALRRVVQPGDIHMISSQTCGWCTAARRWMTQEGLPFDECFIDQDVACRSEYDALGAQGTPTLLVRGQRVVGFDRARIRALLE
ncbi:glutaredoxin family protein [Roseateles sp. BYS87W]|uniref:Glutaredoxin family protein n=1 Tax=Pelomonas baiyunensis TaxID=3299026 RepID=A0ABW7GUS7_9BURK